ncbi:MAG: outer membrane protein transport protein, partial [Bacteroidales bacterium]|nr:outer membrane protein transport protein [Bacteroidales bacterium]
SETRTDIISKYGNISYEKYGTGSISQLFLGAAMNVTPNLAVGAQMIYYFGALSRNSNVLFDTDFSMRDINTGWDYDMNSMGAKVGLQYFNDIAANTRLTVGATYRFATDLDGNYTRFATVEMNGTPVDTISMDAVENYKVEIPSELAFGVSVRKKDKWMFGIDYVRQNWSDSFFGETPGVDFKPETSSSIRAGFEFIPNRYDIRYYLKRATYRFGAYYDKTYINIGGNQINAAGITFGMSLPVFRWYNSLTWSVDLGQRGSLDNNLVRERYIQFNINLNLHDMWFIKRKYN